MRKPNRFEPCLNLATEREAAILCEVLFSSASVRGRVRRCLVTDYDLLNGVGRASQACPRHTAALHDWRMIWTSHFPCGHALDLSRSNECRALVRNLSHCCKVLCLLQSSKVLFAFASLCMCLLKVFSEASAMGVGSEGTLGRQREAQTASLDRLGTIHRKR
jgi:hypothetical protein